MNALPSSQQTKGYPGLPVFEPEHAYITLKKEDGKVSPDIALQSASIVWFRNHRHTLQRATISLVLIAMFIIPLSLGFLVGRARVQGSPAYSAAQFASDLHKGATLVSTPRSTPAVKPSSGKTIPQHKTPSVQHHKHKHPHHKNGNNNENGNNNANEIDT
jgi:hypothetical protein